ncbi:MAG: MerR family transcriptional regulator [Bryobacteraceae bacterium]
MLTVSRLAARCGLSRSTLLYYESIGLLKAGSRSDANYRRYGERDALRLQQICAYREVGLALKDIRSILDRPEGDASSILNRRLLELNGEIEQKRKHQRAILQLLQNKNYIRRAKSMTKEKWVSIMKAAGLTEHDMRRWHTEFERAAPEDHQHFLESLHIGPDEIHRIRALSEPAKR